MRKILTASKDTTLYQAYPTVNAGLDEILEIGKVTDGITEASASVRTLISFELPAASEVPVTASYFLNLRIANASDLRRTQQIELYTVSQSWDEGSGYFNQQPTNANDGATWQQSTTSTSWSLAGGDFISSPSQSITVNSYPLQDLRIDVTSLLQPIVSQSLQSTFYGLAIKLPDSDELDTTNQGNIKVFSTQTHTIYQPTLEIAWDSQLFSTGSLKPIPNLNVRIAASNARETYTKGDVDRISFVVRDLYPLKSFDAVLRYNNKYYLPSTSYYSIVDAQSQTVFVPFDNFSKIDTDPTGSYMVLDTSALYPGRFYTIKLKVVSGQYSRVIDTDILFKVDA